MVPREVEGVRIVHDDADIVVVDKPAGVAAHPSLGWDGPSITEHLAAAGFRISTSGAAERQGVVQRLDVGTSGLMVVAKSEQGLHPAQAGVPRPHGRQGVPRARPGLPRPARRHHRRPDRPASGARLEDGDRRRRPAQRHPLRHPRVFRGATLLEVHLETGRTHQIRVHCQAIGHPCAGDPLYGGDPVLAHRLGLEAAVAARRGTRLRASRQRGAGSLPLALPGRPGGRRGVAPAGLSLDPSMGAVASGPRWVHWAAGCAKAYRVVRGRGRRGQGARLGSRSRRRSVDRG